MMNTMFGGAAARTGAQVTAVNPSNRAERNLMANGVGDQAWNFKVGAAVRARRAIHAPLRDVRRRGCGLHRDRFGNRTIPRAPLFDPRSTASDRSAPCVGH